MCCSASISPSVYNSISAYWKPVPIPPDTSDTAHQPAPNMKCTKPIHRKQKGHSTTVSIIPGPNALIVHMPLDLQPIKDLFNPDAPDDMVVNGHHYSASEDPDFQLDTILQPPTPVLLPLAGAQKGSGFVLGKHGTAPLESGPIK